MILMLCSYLLLHDFLWISEAIRASLLIFFDSEMACTLWYFGYTLAIYMIIFAYLCIIICLHMDAHKVYVLFKTWIIYVFFGRPIFWSSWGCCDHFPSSKQGEICCFHCHDLSHEIHYFCFDMTCIILLDLMTWDKYYISISMSHVVENLQNSTNFAAKLEHR